MSNEQLRAVAGTAVATQETDPSTFPGMLKKFSGEIARALPKHMNPDRMCRVALTCFRQTPALAKCEPASIFAAMIVSAQLGLEPGLGGRGFLIPYKEECQFVPGWKGLLELVNRTGRASAWTGAAFIGDEFDYALGDTPYVKHRPGTEDDPLRLTHAYAVGRIRGGEWPVIEVWTTEKIRKHRDRYNKQGTKHYSYREWEMYARKVPLLQVLKYLPSSPELEAAVALNDTYERGERQGITIDGAISGTYEPPPQPTPRTETTDTDTGEITGAGNGSGAPEVSYASVAEAIKKATSTDQLDVAKDLMRSILDEKQRAELDVEERAKRKALAQ